MQKYVIHNTVNTRNWKFKWFLFVEKALISKSQYKFVLLTSKIKIFVMIHNEIQQDCLDATGCKSHGGGKSSRLNSRYDTRQDTGIEIKT